MLRIASIHQNKERLLAGLHESLVLLLLSFPNVDAIPLLKNKRLGRKADVQPSVDDVATMPFGTPTLFFKSLTDFHQPKAKMTQLYSLGTKASSNLLPGHFLKSYKRRGIHKRFILSSWCKRFQFTKNYSIFVGG